MFLSADIEDKQMKFSVKIPFAFAHQAYCFRLSVGHASKDLNLMFQGLIRFEFCIFSLFLFFIMTTGLLLYKSVCPFYDILCFAYSLMLSSLFLYNWISNEFVGEGAFSKVYLAESKQDKGGLAAVKVINKVKINNIETLFFLNIRKF